MKQPERNRILEHGRSPFEDRTEPLYRPLRVYAFDPSRGNGASNRMTLRVPYERLRPGPIGQRVAVIDYDGARKRFYAPVDLDDPALLLEGGLEPRDDDPRFHQQMAYAVVSQTLRTFDRALGRTVRFRFQRQGGTETRNRSHLKLFPHGIREANAYYARDLHALVFGYFGAALDEPGSAIPGQPVFTCLSHDILVHETCHAVVDGMREYFLEPTNADTLAFHEAFSDLIALFQHFTFPEPLLETLQRTGGRLYRETLEPELELDAEAERNPLVELAQQFGEALGTRRALRSAIGQKPSRDALEVTVEPHERGGILVAAVFEAFFRVYTRSTRDLFRLAGVPPRHRGELHPDLAQRLANEATGIARQFVQLCIRAIELCPPVDLRLGDYLRALVTVHRRADPDDVPQVREALIRAFGRRGIYPPDVRSLSEGELVWRPPEQRLVVPRDLMVLLRHADRANDKRQRDIAVRFHAFCKAHRGPLGLAAEAPIAVRSFHPMRLLGAEFEQGQDVVIELTQQLDLPRVPGSKTDTVRVRGGATLVVANDGEVRYAISKELHRDRQQAQRAFAADHPFATASARYVAPAGEGVDLQALHRGY